MEEKADKEKPEKDQDFRDEYSEKKRRGGRKAAEDSSIYNLFPESRATSREINILDER